MMMQNRELLVKHLVVHVAEPAYGKFSRYGNLTRTDIRQQIAIKQYMFEAESYPQQEEAPQESS